MDTDSNPPCSVPRTVRKTLCQARSSGDARQLATQCSDGKGVAEGRSAGPGRLWRGGSSWLLSTNIPAWFRKCRVRQVPGRDETTAIFIRRVLAITWPGLGLILGDYHSLNSGAVCKDCPKWLLCGNDSTSAYE